MLFNFVELGAFSELLKENGYRKVVFCKDCIYSAFYRTKKTGHCFLHGTSILVREDEFCSKGKTCSKGEPADGKEV